VIGTSCRSSGERTVSPKMMTSGTAPDGSRSG
jgi:hypothetical protein